MEIINLPTFMLEKYDSNLDKHKNNAKIFEADDSFKEYMEPFWSIDSSISYDTKHGRYSAVYFAYINGELVGTVGIIWVFDNPELIVSILPDKRGHHFSSLLLKEYTKYVFDTYEEYNNLYAYIHDENVYSIRNAIAAGFEEFGDFLYVMKRY